MVVGKGQACARREATRVAEANADFHLLASNMGLRNRVQGLIHTLETLRDQLTKENFDSESDELRR